MSRIDPPTQAPAPPASPRPPAPGAAGDRGIVIEGTLLVLLTFAVFLPSLGHGFIWDDDWNVTANPTLRSFSGLVRIWFELFSNYQYYPLTHTSHWILYNLFGPQAWVFHLVNILLHTPAVLLLWILLRRLRVPGSWLAAAICAIHPLQVESVAWITERKNVLSGVFLLLSALWFFEFAGVPSDAGRGEGVRPPRQRLR